MKILFLFLVVLSYCFLFGNSEKSPTKPTLSNKKQPNPQSDDDQMELSMEKMLQKLEEEINKEDDPKLDSLKRDLKKQRDPPKENKKTGIEPGEVIEMKPTIESFIRFISNKTVLVHFIKSTCEYCYKTKRIVSTLSKIYNYEDDSEISESDYKNIHYSSLFQKRHSNLKIVEINCGKLDNILDICRHEDVEISGFPTIRLYTHGFSFDYHGEKEASNLQSWIEGGYKQPFVIILGVLITPILIFLFVFLCFSSSSNEDENEQIVNSNNSQDKKEEKDTDVVEQKKRKPKKKKDQVSIVMETNEEIVESEQVQSQDTPSLPKKKVTKRRVKSE